MMIYKTRLTVLKAFYDSLSFPDPILSVSFSSPCSSETLQLMAIMRYGQRDGKWVFLIKMSSAASLHSREKKKKKKTHLGDPVSYNQDVWNREII